MLDRLQKIKHRFSRGYDFTKDVEVTELFDDFEWLIDSLEVAIKARDGHFKEEVRVLKGFEIKCGNCGYQMTLQVGERKQDDEQIEIGIDKIDEEPWLYCNACEFGIAYGQRLSEDLERWISYWIEMRT